jgi:hypothetical protein
MIITEPVVVIQAFWNCSRVFLLSKYLLQLILHFTSENRLANNDWPILNTIIRSVPVRTTARQENQVRFHRDSRGP